MILDALYHGNIFAAEQVSPDSQAYRDSLAQCAALIKTLEQHLTKDEMDTVSKLQQQTSAASGEESEAFFQYGVALGIMLMHEAYALAEKRRKE